MFFLRGNFMKIGLSALFFALLLLNSHAQQFTQPHGSYFLSASSGGVTIAQHPTLDQRPLFSIGCDRTGLLIIVLGVSTSDDALNLSCASGWRAYLPGLPYQDMLIASASSSSNNRSAIFRALDELKSSKCAFDLGKGKKYELPSDGLRDGIAAMEAACAAQGRLQ
jgi:hypothetical protein